MHFFKWNLSHVSKLRQQREQIMRPRPRPRT